MKPVTLTLTTCKRPELFCETINSWKRNCLDLCLISEVLWADDSSSDDQYSIMRNALLDIFPSTMVKELRRKDGPKGLSYSLNSILDNFQTDLTLHLEDDLIIDRRIPALIMGQYILEEFSQVKQVLFNERRMFPEYKTKTNISFTIWEKGIIQDNGEPVKHGGWSQNPTLTDLRFYRDKYGYFNHVNIEGSYTDVSYDDGIRTACLNDIKLIHLGQGYSAFDINQTSR